MSLLRLTHFVEKNKVTTTELHIATVIINFAATIVTKRLNDVAWKAHTTHSTVSKFIKKIGFDSWNSFIISVLFEEKVKASNYTNDLVTKINLELENVRLFLKTKAQKEIATILKVLINKSHSFIFYGKRLTGNIAQYVTWNFTSYGLFGTHTYFLDELWGILTNKSVLIAFCTNELNADFLEAISRSRAAGAKVISIIVGANKEVVLLSHLSLQVPLTGYFQSDIYNNIIQNEILRYVGLKLFEIWHQRTLVPKN